MTDAGLVPYTLKALRAAGWMCTRLQAGTARGGTTHLASAGWPDIIALRPYVMGAVLVECKTEKGKLRPAQEAFKAWCEKHGHRYVVVRSGDDVAKLVGA